ncbi:MAG: hypothetical protein KDA60_19575, partial [Planctomycetales bacterium]|nr:hypothetical protein [Planctomycetales bacterium]
MGRSYLLFAMLLAAVGIPYVWRNGAPQSLANLADSMWHEAEQTTSTDNPYYPVPATSPPMGGAYSGATG